jgi:hypothetical protein
MKETIDSAGNPSQSAAPWAALQTSTNQLQMTCIYLKASFEQSPKFEPIASHWYELRSQGKRAWMATTHDFCTIGKKYATWTELAFHRGRQEVATVSLVPDTFMHRYHQKLPHLRHVTIYHHSTVQRGKLTIACM